MRWVRVQAAAVACAVLASAGLAGPPAIDGPAEVPAYRLVRLTAKDVDKGTGLLWRVRPLDPGADPKAVDWASEKRAKNLKFVAPPGRYAVTLTTVAKGPTEDEPFVIDEAEVVVIVGGGVPPGPTPPGPQPDADPLVRALKAALLTEPADQRAGAPKLADLYTFAAEQVVAGDGRVFAVNTARELMTATGAKAAGLGLAGTLKATQGVAAAEIRKVVPADLNVQLTPANRADAERVFTRLAAAVKEVTK